jgi:pimeloyl-ACP methyl ester carboxylesterase
MAGLAPLGHVPALRGDAATTQNAPNAFPAFKNDAGKARYVAAYDAALRDWPVPYEEIDAPTRLGPTHVVASGPVDAPPLLLLPSFAGSATVWRLNVAGLSRRFRTYAVDVIGQPGKSVASRRLRNRRDYADWLSDLLGALGVARTSIVGCSFGAFLAMNQALTTPERIERVVLIGPVGTFASQNWKLIYVMRVRTPVQRLMRRLMGDKRKPSLADLGGGRVPAPPRDEKWSALIATTLSEAPKVSVISAPVFSRTQLRSIRAPALLLIGDQERLYAPHAMLKLAMARMPGLEGAVVPDADHIAAMAQPDEVNARIIRFLQSGGPTA